jgi:hypothetical protein
MVTLEVLTLIISLCGITALEDNRSKWTELQNVEKYQNKCRVYYIDCHKKQEKLYKTDAEKITICIRERKH